MEERYSDVPHRRFNPLKEEWVIVAPQRCKRPWQGQTETIPEDKIPEYDPNNPLCPRSKRSSGAVNPNYESTFVFQNDFSALVNYSLPENFKDSSNTDIDNDLFQCQPAQGECRVMCFHPKSNLTLATMQQRDIITVIETWICQLKELGEKYEWVQIFENKGAVMGCSNPHPHCQIWSSAFLPNEPKKKCETQEAYYKKNDQNMLLYYAKQEIEKKKRLILENNHWIVVVPYWAVWPYETMLLPKARNIQRLSDITEEEKVELAEIMQKLLIKYDNLFKCSFPYSMGWHGAPTGKYLKEDQMHWQLHAVYLPPLLRSATVKKFMAGYEMVSEAQRDITPEMAAETLRNLSEIHYKSSRKTDCM